MIKFYFPRWFFPNNLGDSVVSTFIPKLLHHHYKENVEVITYGQEFINCVKEIPEVINVREPKPNEIKTISEWISLSEDRDSFCVYPNWHSKTWSMWSSYFKDFYEHTGYASSAAMARDKPRLYQFFLDKAKVVIEMEQL